jgi:hypothetical protein
MASGIDDLLGTTPPSRQRPTILADSSGGGTAKLFTRYQDAYRVADVVVGVGSTCKVIGYILGGLMGGGGLFALANANVFDVAGIACVIAIISGIVLGVLFYILGTLISAVGQMYRATIDTAVNTSAVLSNESRSRIMGLS